MTPSMTQVRILLSGGIDSSTLIPYYQGLGFEIDAIHFDYGQPSAVGEWLAATLIARHYGVLLQDSPLNTPLACRSNGEYLGRNALLLLAAAARSPEHSIIAIAIHAGCPFYDTSHQFIRDMNQLFDGYFTGTLRVQAPFSHLSKREIYDYGQQVGVPIDLTFSCERYPAIPCGECPSCIDRKILLERS